MREIDAPSQVGCDIDLDAEGKHTGHMLVPHSRNESAWGTLLVPLVSVKRGSGPVVLVTAGNHGDEYEGQLAVLKLIQRLEPGEVTGQLIAVPALNLPAQRADARVSPVDHGNMNRSFPGHPRGTVTQRIAHFVWQQLMPRAAAVIDLHSGGHSLDFVPSAVMHELADKAMEARTQAALEAFGAPVGLRLVELDSVGMLDTAAEEMGRLFISTELGGGATVTAERQRIADRGLANVLKHLGLLAGAPEALERPTRLMTTPEGSYVMARHAGLVEPLVDLGREVTAGQAIARVHFLEHPGHGPVTYHAPLDGLLYCRRVQGWCARGDTLALVAQDLPA
jgi:N-alpha-acetyl-L-2,4-diaminobutyrate deacetylase